MGHTTDHFRDSDSAARGLSQWPPAVLRSRLIRSTAFIWIASRATAFAVTIIAPPPAGSLLIIALVWFLVRFDIRRSGEVVLYQNLAVRTVFISMIVLVVATSLEIALWVGLAVIGVWDGLGTPE